MKTFFKKISVNFYKRPILMTLVFSIITVFICGIMSWIINVFDSNSRFYFSDIFVVTLYYFPIILSIILTIENIFLLFKEPKKRESEKAIKRWEVIAIIIGLIFSLLFILFANIAFVDWDVQLYNDEVHTPIDINSLPTIIIIALVAIIGYLILKFVPIAKSPPLFAVLCISALYLGMAECVLWCVQIFDVSDPSMILLCLFPFNCLLIAIRTIKNVLNQQVSQKNVSHRFKYISKLLDNINNLPWIAFITAIPLLGIIVAILILFGQEPESFIKAWTETADWNISQKVAPQNIYKDEHYLCTVAAGGHPRIVKPIRIGKRHGHKVIVNRQLCIANAFEDLLEERLPNFHHFVRTLYDKMGYPIAKHIRSPYVADVIYFVMKPLEWIFLLFLYLFDTNPENRIAVQYPHSNIKI